MEKPTAIIIPLLTSQNTTDNFSTEKKRQSFSFLMLVRIYQDQVTKILEKFAIVKISFFFQRSVTTPKIRFFNFLEPNEWLKIEQIDFYEILFGH